MITKRESDATGLIDVRFDIAQLLRDFSRTARSAAHGVAVFDSQAGSTPLHAVEAHLDAGALVLRCAAGSRDWPVRRDVPTARELKVLALVREGRRNREIATLLHISHDAVKTRLKHAMAKLCASNRTHAVTLARQRGLLHDAIDPRAP